MAEQNVKGGNAREVSLGSNEAARPANKGGNLLARQDPLIDTQGATPRRVSLLGGAVLSITLAGFAMGCGDSLVGSEKDIPDAGWDGGAECTDDCPGDTDSELVAELCGEPGENIADNEALLAVGGKIAVFTKSKHSVKALEVDPEVGEAVLEFDKPNGETMDSGYEVVGEDDPVLTIDADGEIQHIVFCGIEENSVEGVAARVATDRENGFVHCLDINSGSDSVPVEHEIDAETVEILVSNVHAGGQFAEDGDTEDCEPETDTLKKQYITFEDADGAATSLTSRNILLHSEAQTLKVHKLVEGLLQTFEVDLYEVDGAAGTVKIGTSKLGVGILGVGDSVVANEELRVSLNNFVGDVPDFSYAYEPDMDAEVWVTLTDNPNEVEVNVVSGETTKFFVVRFSDNKGDGMVDVTVLSKSALFVLGSGSESDLDGKIYSSATETDELGVKKITLTPAD